MSVAMADPFAKYRARRVGSPGRHPAAPITTGSSFGSIALIGSPKRHGGARIADAPSNL
jgi:hypothetical protein